MVLYYFVMSPTIKWIAKSVGNSDQAAVKMAVQKRIAIFHPDLSRGIAATWRLV